MTDKATVEIPAPCDGVVASIVGEAGDILPVGAVCIVFDVEGEGNASEAAEPVTEETPVVEATPEPVVEETTPEPAPAPAPAAPAAAAPVARAAGTKALASPPFGSVHEPPTLTFNSWRFRTRRTNQSCRPGPHIAGCRSRHPCHAHGRRRQGGPKRARTSRSSACAGNRDGMMSSYSDSALLLLRGS